MIFIHLAKYLDLQISYTYYIKRLQLFDLNLSVKSDLIREQFFVSFSLITYKPKSWNLLLSTIVSNFDPNYLISCLPYTPKAKLLLLKLIHLFAREVLLVKKLEI